MKDIYLAGGCFWGVQKYFDLIDGIIGTEVGYANGNGKNPNYKKVCEGSGHAEAVHVIYNQSIIKLDRLLDYYYDIIDPTSFHKQGEDEGIQYRTGIYYTDKKDVEIIVNSLESLQKKYKKPIVIEVEQLKNFTRAEKYHQKFLEKHPFSYCHIPHHKFREVLNKDMTYYVTKKKGTEPAFKNKYYNNFKEGIYVDIDTNQPLFSSKDKFQSDCGWPTFSKPIEEKNIEKHTDLSHFMVRTEVVSKTSKNHLGHIFNDGLKELGGKRYCINSAALKFIPKEKMKEEGFENYLTYLEE